jgi:hypothetical protein
MDPVISLDILLAKFADLYPLVGGGLRLQFVWFFYTKAKALPAAGSFALELDGRRDTCGSYFFPLPPALGRCFVSESDAPFLMLDGELR